MKKLFKMLCVISMLSVPVCANALPLPSFSGSSDTIYVETNVNMNNFWEKTSKMHDKVMSVAQNIMIANKINKRTPVFINRNQNAANAYTDGYTRSITVYAGLLPYIDNDDELAYVLSHEMAHDIDFYGGYFKYVAMNFNSKKYELKADLVAIDMMVKAGYNPVAAIIMGNKIFAEPILDWGLFYTHPKGTKRLIAMYKYILIKYPQYLNTPMVQNPYYKNFETTMSKDIKGVKQDLQKRQMKQERVNL